MNASTITRNGTNIDGTDARQQLERVLRLRPQFHRGETEVMREVDTRESLLPADVARKIADTDRAHYGVATDVANYFFDTVQPGWKTLETGLGVSTLAIALKGAHHVCVTPAADEVATIRAYAAAQGIDLEQVTFVTSSSDDYLPGCEHTDLDLVMIDGKHAFPFPIIDWFFTAERLKKGGIMVIDDAEMKSVAVLKDFMDADPRWKGLSIGSGKSFAYRKMSDTVHDVAWHMQPYVFDSVPRHVYAKATLPYRIGRRIRRMIGHHR